MSHADAYHFFWAAPFCQWHRSRLFGQFPVEAASVERAGISPEGTGT